jgi:hypothetical protein
VAYTENGRTCVRLAWQGDTQTDKQQMQDALEQWAGAMPAGAASVTSVGDLLQVQSCDPGTGAATLNNRALDVLQLPAARSEVALLAVQEDFPVDKAFELGQCFVRGLGFDQLVALNADGLTDASQATLESALSDCTSQIGG